MFFHKFSFVSLKAFGWGKSAINWIKFFNFPKIGFAFVEKKSRLLFSTAGKFSIYHESDKIDFDISANSSENPQIIKIYQMISQR